MFEYLKTASSFGSKKVPMRVLFPIAICMPNNRTSLGRNNKILSPATSESVALEMLVDPNELAVLRAIFQFPNHGIVVL